jgi:DNA-binding phage protein
MQNKDWDLLERHTPIMGDEKPLDALDPEERRRLFRRVLQSLVRPMTEITLDYLRHVVNGQMGFETLAKRSDIPSKSLHRMLSARGNPTMKNLSQVLYEIAEFENYEIKIIVSDKSRTQKRRHMEGDIA